MNLYNAIIHNQENFNNILNLQEIIFDSNEFSIDEIKPLLSNFTPSRNQLMQFLLTMNELGTARPTPLEKFTELFSLISSNIRQFFSSDELISIFSKTTKLYISLFNCGLININTIIEKAQTSEGVFKMFYSGIKTVDPTFCNLRMLNASVSLRTFVSNRDKSKQETVRAFQKDDSAHIQQVISHSNIGHSSKIPLVSTECNDEIKFGWQMPSMLEYAAMQGSIDTFKYLLLNKAEFTPKLGNFAILGGNLDIIHILEGYQNFKFTESDFMIAVRFHRNEIADYLVDNYGMSHSVYSLFEALNHYNLRYFFAHIDLLQSFDGLPGNVNWIENKNTKLSLLQLVANNGYLSFLDPILQVDQININLRSGVDGYSALLYAANSGFLDIVKLLIENGANINLASFHEETPLHLASNNGHLEVVKYLILQNKDFLNKLDKEGNTALHLAAKNGHSKIIEFILSTDGILINGTNKRHATPLMLAVSNCRIKAVTLLCNNPNVDVNLSDTEYSPLHMAVVKNALPIVKEIVKLGGSRLDLNTKDRYGQTPLQRALKLKLIDIALYFLDQPKIDVTVKNNDNRNVISFASEMGYIEIVQNILEHSLEFNLNDTDFFRQTALHLAAKNGHFEIMKLLITAGIDTTLKNSVSILHFFNI